MSLDQPNSIDPQVGSALLKGGVAPEMVDMILRHHKDGLERDFLMKYQRALSLWAEHQQDIQRKVIVTLDGRDTAGKGSNIRRVAEQFDLTKHNTSAFRTPEAEERDGDNWFKRYEAFFPEEGKVRFFDRSWYNRAGVEAAMGFCSQEEYEWFMANVNEFERERIIDAGYDFLKIYLSISRDTQDHRLLLREDPRKAWKSSPVDKQAPEKWGYYSLAKQRILENTDTDHAPWIILNSNEKYLSAVEVIKAILGTHDEVRQLIESDLSLDLSPNPRVRRTAKQELKKMKTGGEIDKKPGFKFRQDS